MEKGSTIYLCQRQNCLQLHGQNEDVKKDNTSPIRPKFESASSVWSPHLKNHIELLEKVQKNALRMVPEFTLDGYGSKGKSSNCFSRKWGLRGTRYPPPKPSGTVLMLSRISSSKFREALQLEHTIGSWTKEVSSKMFESTVASKQW